MVEVEIDMAIEITKTVFLISESIKDSLWRLEMRDERQENIDCRSR